jgi:hypothetical protein
MSVKISDEFMRLEMGGAAIATARRRAGDWWEVIHWPKALRPQPGNHSPDRHRAARERIRQ